MDLERKLRASKLIKQAAATYAFPTTSQLIKEELDRIEEYKLSIANCANILPSEGRWTFFEKLFAATCQAVPITALETGSYLQNYARRNGEDVLNHMWALIDPTGEIERTEAGLDLVLIVNALIEES